MQKTETFYYIDIFIPAVIFNLNELPQRQFVFILT